MNSPTRDERSEERVPAIGAGHPDGGLSSLGPYVWWRVRDAEVELDGCYTVWELKAIVEYMERRGCTTGHNPNCTRI